MRDHAKSRHLVREIVRERLFLRGLRRRFGVSRP